MNIRINKLLSDVGLGSRREVEQLVLDGRVAINGQRAKLTDQVEEEDIVTLDGDELPVEDIMREYVAEQKMRIAEQLAGMSLSDDFIGEDPYVSSTPKRKQMGKKVPYVGGGKVAGKGVGKPSKFKKFEDEEEPFSHGRKGGKGKTSRKNFKPNRRPQNDFSLDEFEPIDSFPVAEARVYSQPQQKQHSERREKSNSPSGERRNRDPRKPFQERNGKAPKRDEEHRRPMRPHYKDDL